MKVRLLPTAGADATDAAEDVERLRAGWGDEFDAEFRRAVAAIGSQPRLYSRTEDGPEEPETREFFITRFEYRVIYAIWKDEAVIVTVRHARKRPTPWHTRLSDLD